MNSVRRLSPWTVGLCLHLSVCLLGAGASVSSSLWGKKIHLSGRPCMWQLQAGAVVPALEELSVCMLLRLHYRTAWTGFVYKAPGERHIELGLQGTGAHLVVWLFGEEQRLERELKLRDWHSICLAWSGRARRLRVHVDGAGQHEAPVDPVLPQRLTPNGTLTLGVSHYVDAHGEVRAESGSDLLGDIGLFRMWSREWSAEEVRARGCADGDVVSWDVGQWRYHCPPEPDSSLQCVGAYFPSQHFCPRRLRVVTEALRASSNFACDRCFSCEVYVNVDPAANVEVVQANIAALLSLTFSHISFNLTSDPGSIRILPVEFFPAVTEPPPSVNPGVMTTTETAPTQSQTAQPANMSTTGEPLDINETSVAPDTFFRVNMTLGMTGSPTNPRDIITKWVRGQLEVNKTMIVLNLIIKDNVGRNMGQNNGLMIFRGSKRQYHCTFHVQEYNMNSIAEIKTFIDTALTSQYTNDSITIQGTDVVVKHIVPNSCLEDKTSSIYGEYFWPEAFPQVNQKMGCQKPRSANAYRLCKLDIETDTTGWARPDMKNCKPLVTISGLCNVTVTPGNAAEVVDIIQELVDVQLDASEEGLSGPDLESVVDKLVEVVNISVIEPPVGFDIVSVVADILLSETDITPVANVLLNLTEAMGNNMDFQNESVGVTAPLLALSMTNVAPDEFEGLTFGVSSISPTFNPKIFLNQSFVNGPIPDTEAAISLPFEIKNFFPPGQGNKTRIQFNFYGTQKLFQDPLTTNVTQSSWTLNSYVVSASIKNSHVTNLKGGVVVTLRHITPKQPEDKVQCMFWDFQKNDGHGAWSSRGCVTRSTSPDRTSCLCDHLTHFAVLLDVSRTPISEADSHILTVISYLGCGTSSIFLGITLLTYLAFQKLRKDSPSKILVNLAAALLGLNMVFLLDSWLSSFSNYSLCIATAATLHYFLLASFTWMGLEAVHMYLAMVKVFNIYIPSYILKLCAVGWGVPLVIVSLVLAIDKDAYGNAVHEEAAAVLQSTDQFCWLQDDIFFYVTVVAFVLLILLCNISMFVVVLIKIRRMGANKPSANSRGSLQDLRAVASLTVLLGLTWAVGLFSVGPGKVVLMYLFTIFNTLQGFFVFLFHCFMKENVRKQWRIHLCCGRFRLGDYSEWSHTVTGGGPCNKNVLVNSASVASNNMSTDRKDSDSSTG